MGATKGTGLSDPGSPPLAQRLALSSCRHPSTLLPWSTKNAGEPMVVGGISRVVKECQLQTRPDFADLGLDLSAILQFRPIARYAKKYGKYLMRRKYEKLNLVVHVIVP